MFSHWVLLFSTVAIRTAEEIEVLGLEDIDIDSIDVNSAEFSVLGDTSHIDHKVDRLFEHKICLINSFKLKPNAR